MLHLSLPAAFFAAIAFSCIPTESFAEPRRLASIDIPAEERAPDQGGMTDALRVRLDTAPMDRASREAVLAFYEARAFQPAFTREERFTDGARRLIARLGEARADGFEPADYARPSFAAPEGVLAGDEAAARAEIELASALALYVRHAVRGRADIARLAPLVVAEPPRADIPATLAAMATSEEPVAVLEALHPTHVGFLALRKELARLLDEEMASRPVARAPLIPTGPILRLGSSDPRVPILRARFALAAPAPGREEVMDAAMVAAVRAFQEARGMTVTGAVGAATLRALNEDTTPVGESARRLADIVVNMERWRWLPRDLGERHIWVSVPEFMVRVVEDGRERFSTRVVVGKPETPTPVFSGAMNHFVVNPSWTVPPGIARRDMFPMLARNPEALARRGIQVVRTGGRTVFRQPPGDRNALGRIKFMFPNPHAIYLHDTPSRGLFEKPTRLFSNGCVRVDNPLAFAEAVFAREEGATARRIEAMYGPRERAVRLRHQVPVHLTYFTVEIDASGREIHRSDPYGLDARLKQMFGL